MTDLTAAPAQAAPAAAKGRSLWEDARNRLFRNPAAVASVWILGILGFLALAGPPLWEMLTGHAVDVLYRDKVAIAPTLEGAHLFGTDSEGRDVFARVLYGLGISLMVGIVATGVALVIGVLWGAIAGFAGGTIDNVMMRIVDVLYAVPFIFFVILLMVAFGRELILIFVAIGAVEWLTMSRIVRGQTITLKNKEFVEAARAAGANGWQIVSRHIVPNVLGPVVVFATLNVARVILLESFLSFLGLGVQEPLTSLGALIASGAREMETAPWLLIFPATFMLVTLLCLNFLGDGLRDALDPKDR
jgi:oligopeptide transport system permease protein